MKSTQAARLSHEQQLALRVGQPLASVLTEQQQRHLAWRKRLLGEVRPETGAPSAYLFSVTEDGEQTLMFKVTTAAPQWYWHCYIHRNHEQFNRYNKSRSKRRLYGCFTPRRIDGSQNGGLLADIHLMADGLSELVVVHEAIHAAGYLARSLTTLEAKALAAPYVMGSQSALAWREEIQCRTVEYTCKQIVFALRSFGIHCTPLIDSEIFQ